MTNKSLFSFSARLLGILLISFASRVPARADVIVNGITCVTFANGSCDMGLAVYGINVDAEIVTPAAPSTPLTYVYNQMIFGGINGLDTIVRPGMSLGEVLAQELGPEDNGQLAYDFLLPAGGASGLYLQNGGIPPFPTAATVPTSPGVVNLTAQSVSGEVCNGSNSPGAAIQIDPTNALSAFEAILGCETFSGITEGPPQSSTSTVALNVGTTSYNGQTVGLYVEDTTTTWGAIAGQFPATAPEPSSIWLILAAGCAFCSPFHRKRVAYGSRR